MLSVWLFIGTSLTDFVDGYLARRWKQESAFGAFLDPVADKVSIFGYVFICLVLTVFADCHGGNVNDHDTQLMVATAMILLTTVFPTPLYTIPVAVIMCREIGVSALREWMAEKGIRSVVKVGQLGKWKTALQMMSITILLLSIPGHSRDFALQGLFGLSKSMTFLLGLSLFYASVVATVISGAQYFSVALPYLTESSQPHE
jgi:CDP-diacylglycerol---glycerol-3-phosphate 3-phosphatidyltransferase